MRHTRRYALNFQGLYRKKGQRSVTNFRFLKNHKLNIEEALDFQCLVEMLKFGYVIYNTSYRQGKADFSRAQEGMG